MTEAGRSERRSATTGRDARTTRRWLALAALLIAVPGQAADTRVAVAANFTAAVREIAARFNAESGHTAVISTGSTGKLYAQIINGAPFDVFLAADRERPQLLHAQQLADPPFTYAVGKLVLWSTDPELIDPQAGVLASDRYSHLAVANPKTAPYGVGALQVLRALGVVDAVEPRLVRGDNIAQTYQFVMTGNAQLGFVALAQVIDDPQGSRWTPPQALYDPIRQDATLLARGRDNPAATAFVAFLRGPTARAIIRRYGYADD